MYGTPAHLWAEVIAGLLMLVRLANFITGSVVCVQCGGRDAHRNDCPLKED